MDNMERLRKWKIALTQAANFSGDHRHPGYEYKLTGKIALNQTPDSSSDHCSQGYEYDFIGEIVKYISNKINRVPLHVAKYPVGLQFQVQQVKSLLDNGSHDGVHMVGIYGTGGMGKSTLARAIYNFVADQFEGLCFLHDVRDNSAKNNLKHLQEKLLLKTTGLEIKLDHVSEGIPIIKERLCRKKVLLILDDVDKLDQLEALAGGLDWFGNGSRVIITTRDKHLLAYHGIEKTYAVEELNGTEALELLRWMAFKNEKVPSSYEDILNRAVSYASGLPLAIEVVGSNLFGKSIAECESTLDKYGRIPHEDIQKILKVSFDALDEEQQSVFLDIACCFKGYEWEDAKYILHSHYGHCITHHLGVLAEKSLINHWDDDYDVILHDLIEVMGKEVVRQESPKEPGERSRLWCQDDIVHVLKENTGTSKIEMIYMNFPSMEYIIDQKGKAFKKMTKLKTLIIENGHFSEGLKYLPSSLIVLKWKGCSSESLPSCIFSKKFQNMKVLTFDNCKYLTHIPDVSCLSNLEKLSFQNCDNLITVDDSIGHRNKLESVSAFGCSRLESFPPLWLTSLKKLELAYCESLKSFQVFLCKMTNVKEIELNDTSIGEFPFQNHSELCCLLPCECAMLRFPKHNDKMYSIVFSNVESLYLGNCNLTDECLPILLKWVVNVKDLDLSDNFYFKILPECLSECHLLTSLRLDGCKSLEEIRGIPPNLKILDAMKCESLRSSSRRMFLSQKVHEAGYTNMRFSNVKEEIPDWFEHQIRGDTISFWFRKKIPSITCILLLPESEGFPNFNLFVNGYGCFFHEYLWCDSGFLMCMKSEHAYLFDLKLEEQIDNMFESEMDKSLSKNEWIHVELKLSDRYHDSFEAIEILRSHAQMGIHVWKEESNTEGDVVFLNPYRRRNKFHRMPKKQRAEILQRLCLEETKSDENKCLEVSETESLQQQDLTFLSSAMHHLVLTETKEKHHGDDFSAQIRIHK